MMFSEILVGTTAQEGQMQVREGETSNYTFDVHKAELAVVEHTDAKTDDVTVVPQSLLEPGKSIEHALLPFKVEVLHYYKNSSVGPVDPHRENPADSGAGLTQFAVDARPVSGADTDSKVDFPSAYVRLSETSGKPIGTYLVSTLLDEQPVTVGDRTFDVALRFKRTYKPYQVTLLDVRKDDYLGTETPRNYSSDIRLVDARHGVDRPKIHIWMNNPLRYAGETFYQSNYMRDPRTGVEMTGLSVVTNTGWMIPYVACMIVATGMLAQFALVLIRFLNRRAENAVSRAAIDAATGGMRSNAKPKKARPVEPALAPSNGESGFLLRALPVLFVAVAAVFLLDRARVPSTRDGEMNLYEFGKLPLVEAGRVKPFDSLARNSLRALSGKQTFRDEDDKRQPAIRWLLDVIARPDVADKHRVFRIDHTEVIDLFGIKRRKGHCYSFEEMRPKAEEFETQARQAHSKSPRELGTFERKILELDRKIRTYRLLQASFHAPDFPPLPTEEDLKKDEERAKRVLLHIRGMLEDAATLERMLASMQPPLAVPNHHASASAESPHGRKAWLPYSAAYADAYKHRILGEAPDLHTLALTSIFHSYAKGDAASFNSEVSEYQSALEADPPIIDYAAGETISVDCTNFEAYFNRFEPFMWGSWMYLGAFCLSCLAWLGWQTPLTRSAFWLNVFTLGLHTCGLIARIYISGRPPVTNLYSSAVFIGWGCVLLGFLLEWIFRIGVGNVLAGVSGFSTLLIAHYLSLDGDTFTVLQAVLDTQFWLATHVVCITLGYATTFAAGLLGVYYIVNGVFTKSLTPELSKDLTRMIYGILCFALFFSFVGTILGGLWADDSWGRFWGWDPKENGALIIVLWNALVLHARWDGMVKERGLAVLAVAGNICTSWSWFGVNELGIGLHSYGFTEGVLLALGLFVASQLLLIALGSIPRNRWLSYWQPE
jgi:ABC-type transport system involved in cytochrome c biogenesis permease subunit